MGAAAGRTTVPPAEGGRCHNNHQVNRGRGWVGRRQRGAVVVVSPANAWKSNPTPWLQPSVSGHGTVQNWGQRALGSCHRRQVRLGGGRSRNAAISRKNAVMAQTVRRQLKATPGVRLASNTFGQRGAVEMCRSRHNEFKGTGKGKPHQRSSLASASIQPTVLESRGIAGCVEQVGGPPAQTKCPCAAWGR